MPDNLAVIDPQGLASLVDRLARLKAGLDKIAADRAEFFIRKKNGTLKGEDDIDQGALTRRLACEQLIAVLNFIENSDELVPELHQLLNALLDIERNRPVAWLNPKKRGKPPPGWIDISVHARCAWVMDFLMQKTQKSEEEAARFVVEHGALRTWLEARSQQNSAADWRVVANWRDRINGGSCTEEERIAFDGMAEIANLQLTDPKDVEREARKLLRGIKIYLIGGLTSRGPRQ